MKRILFVLLVLGVAMSSKAQHTLQIDDGAGRYGIIQSNPLWPIGTTVFTMPPTGGTIVVAPPPGTPSLVWLTDPLGNTLTGGGPTTPNERLGSDNNYDVVMITNNVEQFRLRASGGVNIPSTNASGVGVIYQNGTPFIHSNGGNSNFFAGYQAGNLSTSGTGNTGTGSSALVNITTGTGNTAFGNTTLVTNTTGASNTAMGASALFASNGDNNTAIGRTALTFNSSGSYNSGFGTSALQGNTTGGDNTGVGYFAGAANTVGTLNTYIGRNANASANNLTNSTAIGANSIVDASNKIQLGNGSVTRVASAGSLSVRNVDYVWPAADGAGVLMSNGALALSWNNTPTLGSLTLNGNLDMNQNDIIDLGDIVFSQATSNISNSAGSVIISDALQVNNAIDAQGGISNGAFGGSGLVLNDDVLIQGIAHHNGVTNLNNQNELHFKELNVNGANHLSFRAPAALAADISFTLPVDGGTAGQVLTTSGGVTPTLSWSLASGWALTGNALTGGTPATANEWLGSSNNYDVIFRSNNAERMRIASGGNVGIGSTSPFTQLTMPGQVPSGSVGSVATGTGPMGIAVSGRYAYVVNETGTTLQVIDISNPAAMVVEGTTAALGGQPRQMCASGRYAYVANEGAGSLQIIDVANPTAPVLAGSIAAASCNSVHVVGRYAYVTSYGGNVLRIIDVSNPTAPVQLSTVATGSNPTYVYVSGNYAFVTAEMSSRLECYDVSNPTAPVAVSNVGGMTRPYSVNVSDKYAYVADFSAGNVYVVDISNPAAMSIVGTVGGLGSPYYLHASGRYVYAVATGGTLNVIDVSNPASPASLGTSATGAFPFAVYSAGRYVYVCNRTSNTVTAHDMGGAYVQTLETGNLEAARIQVRNDININGDIAAKGGIVAGTAEFHGGVGIASGGFKVASGGTVTVAANVATINAAQYSAIRITSDNNGTNDVITINGGVEGQTLYIYYNHTAGNDDIVLAGTTVTVGNNQPAGITMCYIVGAWRVVGTFLP